MEKIWDNPYLRFIILGLVFFAFYYWILRQIQGVVVSFLVAFLLAYLLSPFVDRVARRTNRALGLVAVVLSLVGFLALLWLLGLQVSAQLSSFAVKIPLLIEILREVPFRAARFVDPSFGGLFQQVYLNLERLSRLLTEQFLPSFSSASQSDGFLTLQTITRVAGSGAQVAIILILTLYLLYNFPAYTRSFLRAFPHRHRPIVEDLVTTAGTSVGGFVRGQIFIAFAVGVMVFIGLAILRVPLALALGVLAGIANLIPFLGPILAAVPTAIVGFTQSSAHMLGAVAVLLIANQIDAHVLTPLVMSRAISLDPVTVIVAILIGSALMGFVGALIAVPAAAFLKVLYTTYYLESAWYRRPPQR